MEPQENERTASWEPPPPGKPKPTNGDKTIGEQTAMLALGAAMENDVQRLRALISTLPQRDRDHLAKSADRLALAADDDML